MKVLKKVLVCLLACAILAGAAPDSEAKLKFSKSQQKVVDTIYDVVSKEKNWKKYGSLPSVCIAQAYVESGIGAAGNRNNLWGINGGRSSYKTLKKGIYAYMEVINKSFYSRYGATDTKDWKKQISRILRGGYCVPAGGYYSKVARVVKSYGLKKYDKKMFKSIEKAKKLRIQKKKEKAKEKARKLMLQQEKAQRKKLMETLPSIITETLADMTFKVVISVTMG